MTRTSDELRRTARSIYGRGRQVAKRGAKRLGLLPERLPDAYSGNQVSGVGRGIDDAFAGLEPSGSRIGAYGDAAFCEEARVRWSDAVWLSHRLEHIEQGAEPLTAHRASLLDAIVIGGPELKASYSIATKELATIDEPPLIGWCGEGFEFSGSTVPIPAEVGDADVYLYNHFADLFAVRDPLVVHVSARDDASQHVEQVLLSASETRRWSLSTMLPERTGPAVVEVRCEHPKLSGGRHQRWRMWIDVRTNDSMASLHGAHEYGDDHGAEAVLPGSFVGDDGRYVLAVPNYQTSAVSPATVFAAGATTMTPRRSDAPVTEIPIEPVGGRAAYRYHGHGGAFWFGFAGSSLSSNHEAAVPVDEPTIALGPTSTERLRRALDAGFLPGLHCLPRLPDTEPVEFGVAFDWSNPVPPHIRCIGFDEQGGIVSDEVRDDLRAGLHVADDLADPGAAVVAVAPDFERSDLDPSDFTAMFNLVARHRATGDRDATEFQSSWRNLGVAVPGFPHWLHEMKGVNGSTTLVGRWTTERATSYLLAMNGSGRLAYDRPAELRATLLDPSGTPVHHLDVELGPFGYAWVALDPPDTSDTWGSVSLRSDRADLTCQIATVTEAGAVGLQHLWGY